MQGRLENERKMDMQIISRLQNEPKYMMNYMKSFVRKSYTTKNAYINYVLEFIYYLKNECGYDINDIDVFSNVKPSTINGYLDYLSKLEKVTKNGKVITNGESIQSKKFYAIKDFFKFLMSDDYVSKNPCSSIDPPKVDVDINIIAMDQKEMNLFLNNVLDGVGTKKAKARQSKWRNRDYAITTLALFLGLRVTSISEINVDDVNFENNSIVVTEKGNKTRELRFSDNLKEILLRWLEDREEILDGENLNALFISNQKKRLCTKSIELLVAKYSEGIDKHITPHKLRSTCATNIYTATGDIYLTADAIGHRNIQNTKRYAKIVNEKQEKLVNTMDKIMFG